MARAAWAGLLATALNLLPIGQLDGGHILYAFVGARLSRCCRYIFMAALIPMGIFFAYSWLVWAALLFFFGLPPSGDLRSIGRSTPRARWLAHRRAGDPDPVVHCFAR